MACARRRPRQGRQAAGRLARFPVPTTWNAIDLVPEAHPRYFGRANAYGPRYANFVIQNADYLLTIGARLGSNTPATTWSPSHGKLSGHGRPGP